MAITRAEILRTARSIVASYGLGDLTMRRLATELGVQPSALYWHVDNKQALLAQIADELLAAVPEPSSRRRWDRQVTQFAGDLRATLLAQRDGAEIVTASRAASLGTSDLGKRLEEVLGLGGLSHPDVTASRDALLHFVLGFVQDEQTHATMAGLGAAPARADDPDAAFTDALDVIVAGVRSLAPQA
ncbi:TetR/AcrR family transcriptional regulator C-terminal domain-containing protein [Actinomycetota bacterium]